MWYTSTLSCGLEFRIAVTIGAIDELAFTVAWYVLARRRFDRDDAAPFGYAAVATLFLGHIAATVAGQASASSLFGTLLLTHVVIAVAILVIAHVTESYVLATILVPILAFATGLSGAFTPAREFVFAAVLEFRLDILLPTAVLSVEPALLRVKRIVAIPT